MILTIKRNAFIMILKYSFYFHPAGMDSFMKRNQIKNRIPLQRNPAKI